MNAEGYCTTCNQPLGISGQCAICAVNEISEKEAFQARFKKLLAIAGDNHELKRAVARIGKAHGAITIFDKDNMWAHRYVADVSMLLERLDAANNKSVDTLRDRMIAQAKGEDEQEAWLRERFTALRFPVVKDVYVSTAYSFYVSFERLLTRDEIMLAGSVNLRIELTYPLPNRYRVVFEAPDVEEA
jgi:hypothetical protein